MPDKLTVSEEAINQANALRTQVIELHKDLLGGAKALLLAYTENKSGLGYHDTEIEHLLEALVEDSNDSATVKKLTRKLKLTAETIRAHQENNGYSGKSR